MLPTLLSYGNWRILKFFVKCVESIAAGNKSVRILSIKSSLCSCSVHVDACAWAVASYVVSTSHECVMYVDCNLFHVSMETKLLRSIDKVNKLHEQVMAKM